MKRHKHLPRSLTASVEGKREKGRPLRKIRDDFAGEVSTIMPELGIRGRARDWTGHALDASQGGRIVNDRKQREREEFDDGEERDRSN